MRSESILLPIWTRYLSELADVARDSGVLGSRQFKSRLLSRRA